MYINMKKCPPSSFDSLKAILGMLLLFNVFVVPMYNMGKKPKKSISILKQDFDYLILLCLVLVFC